MTEKMLKVFISSTYRDLKDVRELLIQEVEEALEAVAMETFVPIGTSALEESLKNLESSDICIFIIGDYYGTVIGNCTLEMSCECNRDISFTQCEYKRAVRLRKPHLTYIVTNQCNELLSGIQKFDLRSNERNEVYKFLKENGKDTSKAEFLSDYSLEEIRQLWEISNDKNREKLKEFKEEVKKQDGKQKLCFLLEISGKKDYYSFYETVTNQLKKAILNWYTDRGIQFQFRKFAGRREELVEFLQKVDAEKSVCVIGTGGVGKTALIQVGLLLEKLSGRKVYAAVKEYSYQHTRAGYSPAKGMFIEKPFATQVNLTDILELVFEGHAGLDSILRMGKEEQISALRRELDREGSILFIDDLHDAAEEVRTFLYSCGNNLTRGVVVAGTREKKGCFSSTKALSGLKNDDLTRLIEILIETYSVREQVSDLPAWSQEVFRITQGHPMLVDLMANNASHFSDCQDLRRIESVKDVAKQEAVNEAMDRLIHHILRGEKKVEEFLGFLSIFHVPMERRFLKVEDTIVNSAIDKGLLQWERGRLVFTFAVVKELLEDRAPKEYHEKALEYYFEKVKMVDESERPELYVEIMYHQVKTGQSEKALKQFRRAGEDLVRVRKRAIDVSEMLLEKTAEENGRANVLNGLGNLLLRGREFSGAECSYKKALETYKGLAGRDPDSYEFHVATALNNLGNVYSDLRDFKKAEEFYNEALEIRRKLAQRDPGAYEPDLAMTLNNFGNLHKNLRDFKKAEEFYNEALQIYRKLAQRDPDSYEFHVATALNNLGNVYSDLRDFKKAEEFYNEALEIYRSLAQRDPGAYEPDLAMTLNNLGILYDDLRDFKKAEESYNEALEIYRRLAQGDPGVYEFHVAGTLNNLGNLHRNLRDFKKAEEFYNEALQIYRKLAQRDPSAYGFYMATALNNLGNVYSDLKGFKKAEESYNKALAHKDTLPDDGACIYLGLADIAEKMHKQNACDLYFAAAVTSFNVYVQYRLSTIDFLHCFQKTQELSPSDSLLHRMAKTAFFSISKAMNPQEPTGELRNINVSDLPGQCRALILLITEKETTHIEEPRDDIESMFYFLYRILSNQH